MTACGNLLFAGLFVVYASLSFFTLEGLEFMNIFTDGAREFGRCLFSVYGKGVLRFLTYVILLALFQYYPFLFVIGRSNSPWYALSPLFCLLFLLPCALLWRVGVRRFQSTGS